MKNKAFWLLPGILTVAALILVSCSPRAATPAPSPTPVTPAAPAVPAPAPVPGAPAPTTPAPAASTEKPKYGGTINVIRVDPRDIDVWDSAAGPVGMGAATYLVYDRLVDTQWEKGKAGSGQFDFGLFSAASYDSFGPNVVESWEYREGGTWIMKIRQGIHFALNPASEASRLVNGRELTTDDVVWSIWRYTTDPAFPNAGIRRSQGQMARASTVEKTGPREVTLKTPVDPWVAFFWIVYGGNSHHQFAPEVIKKYGDGLDWRNAVGTGPFMVTDVVPGSIATFIKNPNWFKKDPVGPGKGNQVPYLETVKVLIVPDSSTRAAAMRTGRADWVTGVEQEDALALIRTTPRLNSKGYQPGGYGIRMWIDKPELPFKDKRVRQALTLAIDYEALKNELYGGKAEIQIWPVIPAFDWVFVPMKDMPESVQTLYKYNPEKAKQLLAEAGYPKGFKTKMIVRNASTEMDPAAVIKAMWAKVGVEVELQPRETAVFTSITTARSWEEMLFNTLSGGSITQLYSFSGAGLRSGGSPINDPVAGLFRDKVIEDAFQEVQKNIILNFPKADDAFKKMTPYVMEQAYIIPVASPFSYTLWQPWLKNHYGELTPVHWLPYAWIDQDLKEQMTGRR